MPLALSSRVVQVYRVWAFCGTGENYRATDLIGSQNRHEADAMAAKARELWEWLNMPENLVHITSTTAMIAEFHKDQPVPPRDQPVAHDRYTVNREAVIQNHLRDSVLKDQPAVDEDAVLLLARLFADLGDNITLEPRRIGVAMMPLLRTPQRAPTATSVAAG